VKNRIKQLRDEKKMTQVRLSTELEVSQETISSYVQKEKAIAFMQGMLE